jgi:hypothetical protein
MSAESVRPLLLLASATALLVSACDAAQTPAGCSEAGAGTCYRYQAFDEMEVLTVEGDLFIADDADPTELVGSWTFDRVGPSGVGPQVGSGVASGQVSGEAATLSLAPATPDDAVVLDGTLTDRSFEGTWTWFDAGAPVAQGVFQARRDASVEP